MPPSKYPNLSHHIPNCPHPYYDPTPSNTNTTISIIPPHPTSSHSGGGRGGEGMRTDNSRSILGRSIGRAPTENQQDIKAESTTIGSRGE